MRILITPEANTAETAGSIVRTSALAAAALDKRHDVAFCAGQDINFNNIDGIKNYYSDIPSPIGVPRFFGRVVYKLYKYFGLQKNEIVEDYETIFHYIGLSSKGFFQNDVVNVCNAIEKFKPDILFTEHRLSPIVAAKIKKIKIVTTYSLPIHNSFKSINYGKYSSAIIKYIKKLGLPSINSVLDLYNWTNARFIPSTYDLEPVNAENVIYVGPLIDLKKLRSPTSDRNKILVYLGNSGFTTREIQKTIAATFRGTQWKVYITSKEMATSEEENICIAPYFDFNELLPNAFCFISHGGQNSLMQSLLYGVPMISFPGGVQERRFNSEVLEKHHVGKMLENIDFYPQKILSVIEEFKKDTSYCENAISFGKTLTGLGGAESIIQTMEKIVKENL
jgi:uncharacterized protein (TIGR00661 family)